MENKKIDSKKSTERPGNSERQLKDAGKMLDLPVIDHIIIGEDNYYSFADEGGI